LNLLADESVDQQIVDGHSVWYVAEIEPGTSDQSILKKANDEKMLLLTADKDFGELVFRQKQLTTGVVLLRLTGLSQQLKSETVAVTLQQHSRELDHCFSVISPGHIRIRKSSSV
jgi:predicted nuclease of predicted toxin-antitoxin system